MRMAPVKTVVLGTMEISRRMNLTESAAFLKKFQDSGHVELDTAFMYGGGADGGDSGGLTEEYMGQIDSVKGENVATKVNPGSGKTLSAQSVKRQLEISLKKLNADSLDLLYLHWPCTDVPLKETLQCVNELYTEGKIKRFGLSNFISWQVAEIQQICIHNGYLKPTVYQGMYNCLTRMVETELFPCLRKYGMSFYAYNPLAGGLLTGKHDRSHEPEKETTGRFAGAVWGKAYRDRFWKDTYFDAADIIKAACVKENVEITAAVLRWMKFHSAMSGDENDAIIISGSSIDHLVQNLNHLEQGPLPESIVDAIEKGNVLTKGHCANYFRNLDVSNAKSVV